jgi:hypothetical protein
MLLIQNKPVDCVGRGKFGPEAFVIGVLVANGHDTKRTKPGAR